MEHNQCYIGDEQVFPGYITLEPILFPGPHESGPTAHNAEQGVYGAIDMSYII